MTPWGCDYDNPYFIDKETDGRDYQVHSYFSAFTVPVIYLCIHLANTYLWSLPGARSWENSGHSPAFMEITAEKNKN